MPARVYITTFGCQMNKLDSELIMGDLLARGYEKAESEKDADVILYNTCAVREHAQDRVYSRMGRLKFTKRSRPGVLIGLIGCMAPAEREKLFLRIPHLDFAAGPGEFGRMHEIIDRATASGNHTLAIKEDRFDFNRTANLGRNPFQAFVSIMRGCDNYCSYCIVPYTRGREYSRPSAEIIEECRMLSGKGVVEITLLGQNVNSYGKGLDEKTCLADLLCEIDKIGGLRRVRFITNHPKDLSDGLVRAVADLPSVCEYLHLPAQSGSDAVLAAMNRGYTRARYDGLLEKARSVVTGIEIAGDFIVGFPGETEEDFAATTDLVRNADFQNSFVFKYSPRPGTKAAEMEDSVPLHVKKERNNALLAVQKENSKRRQEKMEGRTIEVLVEGPSPRDPAKMLGRSRMNHIVVFPAESGLAGGFVNVKINSSTPLTLFGDVVRD